MAERVITVGLPNCATDHAVHPRIDAAVTAEMSRLFSAGHSLVPLGGPDGKVPIVAFRDRKRLPLALVMDRMGGAGSNTYGIRLNDLLVIDVDTDTPEARAYVEERFGSSPARTETSRGYHLYFRHTGPKPSQVREPGIAIDFKSGPNEFVVGPQSIRADGTRYLPQGQVLAPSALPLFTDRHARTGVSAGATGAATPGRHPKGSRHRALKRRAHQLASTADSLQELIDNLLAFRDWEIEAPEEFSDAAIQKMAGWFWEKRESGELWGGSKAVVQIDHKTIATLASRGEGTALLLLGLLLKAHGGQPGKTFAVVPDGLKNKGLLKAGRNQIYSAIDVLLDLGLLVCCKRARGNRNHHHYQLGSGEKEKTGERSLLLLVPSEDTHSPAGTAPETGVAA